MNSISQNSLYDGFRPSQSNIGGVAEAALAAARQMGLTSTGVVGATNSHTKASYSRFIPSLSTAPTAPFTAPLDAPLTPPLDATVSSGAATVSPTELYHWFSLQLEKIAGLDPKARQQMLAGWFESLAEGNGTIKPGNDATALAQWFFEKTGIKEKLDPRPAHFPGDATFWKAIEAQLFKDGAQAMLFKKVQEVVDRNGPVDGVEVDLQILLLKWSFQLARRPPQPDGKPVDPAELNREALIWFLDQTKSSQILDSLGPDFPLEAFKNEAGLAISQQAALNGASADWFTEQINEMLQEKKQPFFEDLDRPSFV